MIAAVVVLGALLLVELVLHYAEKEQWGKERASLLNRLQFPDLQPQAEPVVLPDVQRWVPEEDGELALVGQVFVGEDDK